MLTIYFGSMFSEKSGDMLKRALEASLYQKKKVLFLKPSIDDRFGEDVIQSRTGLRVQAFNIPCDLRQVFKNFRESGQIVGQNISDYDLIVIDEGQFFSKEIVPLVEAILAMDKAVYIAALNLDYRGKPIGSVGELILQADKVVHKTAYCSVCGAPALFSQRLVNNEPFTEPGQTVFIGNSEYEPRCRKHFVRGNDFH